MNLTCLVTAGVVTAITNQDLISIIREAMAECGKYNDKQMDTWYDKLTKFSTDKLKSIIKDPLKFGLKCRVNIPQKFKL